MMAFDKGNRNRLIALGQKVDRKHPYNDFQFRKKMEALRHSWVERQQYANDRAKLQQQIRDRTMANALQAEYNYIEGHKSHMNLPPHLAQRLSELQQELGKMYGGRALRARNYENVNGTSRSGSGCHEPAL